MQHDHAHTWRFEGPADLSSTLEDGFIIHLAPGYLFLLRAVISYLFDFYLVTATDALRGLFHL